MKSGRTRTDVEVSFEKVLHHMHLHKHTAYLCLEIQANFVRKCIEVETRGTEMTKLDCEVKDANKSLQSFFTFPDRCNYSENRIFVSWLDRQVHYLKKIQKRTSQQNKNSQRLKDLKLLKLIRNRKLLTSAHVKKEQSTDLLPK